MDQTVESEFLQNVAQRLGRNEPLRATPKRISLGAQGLTHSHLPESLSESYTEETDVAFNAAVFCLSLENVGGQAKVIARNEIPAILSDIVTRHQIHSVMQWKDALLEHLEIPSLLHDRGLDVYTWGEESVVSKTRIEKAQLGITSANYAIAETGSLVVIGNHDQGRSVSLLPSVHVAFVPLTRLYLRAQSVLQELQQQRMPASVNFITGPSRTSDIEMDSTIGVHGPKYVYVFLTDET